MHPSPGSPIPETVSERNSRLANIVILLVCASLMLGMALVVSRIGWAGLRVNGTYTAIGALLYLWRPVRYTWKSIAVCLWLLAYVTQASWYSLATGMHSILLLMPAIFFFLFELRHARQIALATLAVVLLYLMLVLGPDGLRAPSPLDFQLIFNAFATMGALYVISLYSFRALASAEAKLAEEHARSERLLAAMLPERVARRLKDQPNATVAEGVPDATVLFADLVGFTEFAARHRPEVIVAFLNQLFSLFDEATERHRLDKVKTMGDGYMVAGGLDGDSPDHAARMAALAQDMMRVAGPILDGAGLALRIGLHRGPVTAGVIGRHKPFFDIWGDTVNVAARMETEGAPGKIQMSRSFADTLPEDLRAGSAHQVGVAQERDVTAFWLKLEGDAKPEDAAG